MYVSRGSLSTSKCARASDVSEARSIGGDRAVMCISCLKMRSVIGIQYSPLETSKEPRHAGNDESEFRGPCSALASVKCEWSMP